MDTLYLLDEMRRVARHCGEMMLVAGEGGIAAERKTSFRDLVTDYDKRIQAYAVNALSEAFPDAGFVCEEGSPADTGAGALTFVIDPIDGTLNFVHHFRHSCTSIACMADGEAVAGVVINPYSDELFYAARGAGAFLNGRRLRILPCSLAETMALFGTSPYNPEVADDTFTRLRMLFGRCRDIRRAGAAALDLCYVAAGRAGLYFEERICLWDYAAGALIVREAGGICTDLEGNPLSYGKKDKTACVAGCADLVREFVAMT